MNYEYKVWQVNPNTWRCKVRAYNGDKSGGAWWQEDVETDTAPTEENAYLRVGWIIGRHKKKMALKELENQAEWKQYEI
jgi:hypothetical protein